MKSIVLLLSVVLNDGTGYKQTWYYDTMQECTEHVHKITSHAYPFQLKAECMKIIPEVEENASSRSIIKPV